jgi:hypothetical protein
MKKTYEKPVFAKVADLPRATAQRYGISGYYCPPYEVCLDVQTSADVK